LKYFLRPKYFIMGICDETPLTEPYCGGITEFCKTAGFQGKR